MMRASEAPHIEDTPDGWFAVIPSLNWQSGPFTEDEAQRVLFDKCRRDQVPIAETKYGQPIYVDGFVSLGGGMIAAPEVQYPACNEAKYDDNDSKHPPPSNFQPIDDPYGMD